MSHLGMSIKDLLLSEYWPFMSHCVDHHLLTKEISEKKKVVHDSAAGIILSQLLLI